MNLQDELRARLKRPKMGGWKELVQGKPEVRDHLITIIGTSIAKGQWPVDRLVIALNLVLGRKQHINDLDLLLILKL